MIKMKSAGATMLTEEDLEKILLIGRIKVYDNLKEKNYLVDYYILTGEIPDDCESAKKFLTKDDFASQML